MTNVRSYLKEKEKRSLQQEEQDFSEKIHHHRMTKLYTVLTCVSVVTVVTLSLFLFYKLRNYHEYTITSSVERTESASSKVLRLGSNIISYSNDGASCVDEKGSMVWNQTFEMQSPIVDICGSCIAIADYSGSNIYIMNEESILGTISTNMPIRQISVSASGVVAAVLDDSTLTWINVYDKEGNVLAFGKAQMEKSGYPLAVALSPSAQLMAVSYLFVDSGVMRTDIGFYNFGEVGQNELHNYVSGYSYDDTVVPYIEFLDDETAVAVADDRIMFYIGAQKPAMASETLLGEEIKSVFNNDEYIGLVFDDTTGESLHRMDIYNKKGEKKVTTQFDLDYSMISICDDRIIAYNNSEWVVFSMSGKEKFSGAYEGNIRLVTPQTGFRRYMIITETNLEHVLLK